jgi:hypothetical protein
MLLLTLYNDTAASNPTRLRGLWHGAHPWRRASLGAGFGPMFATLVSAAAGGVRLPDASLT